MNFMELPENLILKIFEWLTICDLNNIALVSKDLYKIVGNILVDFRLKEGKKEIIKSNKIHLTLPLFIKFSHDENVNSLMTTKRKFFNISVRNLSSESKDIKNVKKLLLAFKKFASEVEKFEISCNLVANDILMILSMANKIEYLEIRKLDNSNGRQLLTSTHVNIMKLLKKLRHLCVIECDDEVGKIFIKLPRNCLESLEFHNVSNEVVSKVILNQHQLKTLSVLISHEKNVYLLSSIAELSLETLKLYFTYFKINQVENLISKTTINILKSQKNLKILSLVSFNFSTEVFKEIGEMQLRILAIASPAEDPRKFRKLFQSRTLETLTIFGLSRLSPMFHEIYVDCSKPTLKIFKYLFIDA
ncbi:CLUMA_CG019650, isoform A [Clunio marinus]|uniref:CLUMA_CG019650, isoform A n=1 Tax=Clunio marinus TaxID=568069 RepID=A0A1J1J413_9DIPT|nr:CLUMA_CG019650, isoform A [Clunio marinus]